MPRSTDFPEDNADSLAAWTANAAFWDEAQGDEGNFWQRELVFPTTLELLESLSAESRPVLELACGNGAFARLLAKRGLRVLASDASRAMVDRAVARTEGTEGEQLIRWRVVDAANPDDLKYIPEYPYSAAVCNMALMDIAAIEPLFNALPRLLQPWAPFVFSVLHPAFNQGPASSLFMERRETEAGELVVERGVRVAGYLEPRRQDGVAVVGQPVLQPYFHRPIEALLAPAFKRGWVLDALREPSFGDSPDPDDADRFTWDNLPEIPPILVVRLRYFGV